MQDGPRSCTAIVLCLLTSKTQRWAKQASIFALLLVACLAMPAQASASPQEVLAAYLASLPATEKLCGRLWPD